MAKKDTNFAFFQVVKNGVIHANERFALKKSRRVFLSNAHGPLLLEHITLPSDFIVGEISGGKFELCTQDWHGFATSKGTSVELDGQSASANVPMFPGDFAALQAFDFTVNLRIGQPPRKERFQVARDKDYGPKPFSLLIQSTMEGRAVIGAAALSLLFIFGFVAAVISFQSPRPTTLEELKPEYALTFIDPDHLRYAPEALQSRYSDRDLIPAVSRYYRALASMLLGVPYSHMELQPPNSIAYHKNELAEWRNALDSALIEQRDVESDIEGNPAWALPMVPIIHEQSIALSSNRIMSLVAKHHDALATDLEFRRRTTKSYKNDFEDYVETDYRDVQKDKSAQEQLAKIHVVQTFGPEETMYQSAEGLAIQAAYQQLKTRKNSSIEGQSNNAGFILVPPGFKFASITNMVNWRGDRKFQQILGTEFGKEKEEKPVYRVTGTLPSALIQSEIAKKKYELQLCYELALRRNHAASGSVEWSWIIDKRGHPQEISLLTDTIRDNEMIGCIRKKLSRWTFPRPENGSVRVRYPFVFQPAKG